MTHGLPEEVIDERAQFRAALAVAAELRRDIARIEATRDSFVIKIQARYERRLDPLRNDYAKAIKPVLDYIRKHHKELFAETSVVDEVDASLKRTPSSQLGFNQADEASIIALLEEAGHDDLVNTTKSLKKDPIKKRPDIVDKIPGLRIAQFINVLLTFKPRPASDAKPSKKLPTETVQIEVVD